MSVVSTVSMLAHSLNALLYVVRLNLKAVLQDLQNLGARNVCLMTDKNLSRLPPVKAVLDSLAKAGVKYKVYDNVRVEPTDAR